MQIAKQSVLQAFEELKQIFWDDFTEKEIFFDIGGFNDRSIQLRSALADLIKEGTIKPLLGGRRPAWILIE